MVDVKRVGGEDIEAPMRSRVNGNGVDPEKSSPPAQED